jgi:hypothetical protein
MRFEDLDSRHPPNPKILTLNIRTPHSEFRTLNTEHLSLLPSALLLPFRDDIATVVNH